MEKAVIGHGAEELEAWEHEDRWTVRLGEREVSARYLDLALAALLDESESVHEIAARLLASRGSVRADAQVAA